MSRIEILKQNSAVASFDTVDGSMHNLHTKDKGVLSLIKEGVPAIQGKYIPGPDTMLTMGIRLKPGDKDFLFHFLNMLEMLGYKYRIGEAINEA